MTNAKNIVLPFAISEKGVEMDPCKFVMISSDAQKRIQIFVHALCSELSLSLLVLFHWNVKPARDSKNRIPFEFLEMKFR